MGQKSNPISLRLEKTNMHWVNCWYGDLNYATQLKTYLRYSAYIHNSTQQLKRVHPIIFSKHTRGETNISLISPRFPHFLYKNYPEALAKRSKKSLNKFFTRDLNMIYKKSKCSVVQQLAMRLKFTALTRKQKHIRFLLFALQLGIFNNVICNKNTPQHSLASLRLQRGKEESKREKNALVDANNFLLLFVLALPERALEFQKNKTVSQQTLSRNALTKKRKDNRNSVIKNCFQHTIYKDLIKVSLNTRCKVELLKCSSIYHNPNFIASHVVFLLQARVPFRQLKHKIIKGIEFNAEKSFTPQVKGMRICCSGRVPARSKKAQKARIDTIQWGETSLNVFSEWVHFASKSALTGFGKIGVKVWVCYTNSTL